MKKYIVIFFGLVLTSAAILAQTPQKPTSGEIYESIKKLNFLGSVLYVAAHPDDENTRLISYLSNDVKARTAYLSVTRGDGGQNLIGPEISEFLGVIRTHELLEARKIDGAEQYFTRANDFGYSKHSDETFEIWDKDQVLMDMVTVIRNFKPDIIINRFNHENAGSTHGHHTASAILGMEAFDLASDENYKTPQNDVKIWQPKRLFFNTSWWFYGSEENFNKADKTNLLQLEVGSYFPNLGLSNGEIAALSRSKHKSQGFGSSGTRGSQTEYLNFLKGEFPVNKQIFDGIDTSWNRVENGKPIGELLQKIENEFDFNHPSKSVPQLVNAYQLIQNLNESHWKEIKEKEIIEVIAACSGLFLEVFTNEKSAAHGQSISLNIEATNRSEVDILLKSVQFDGNLIKEVSEGNLKYNKSFTSKINLEIPENSSLTSPYWLWKKGTVGMYDVSNPYWLGLADTPHSLGLQFLLEINGVEIPVNREIVNKFTDPVKGETYRPFEIIPEVSVSFLNNVALFTDNNSKKIDVKIKSGKENIKGSISLCFPEKWKILPENIPFDLEKKGEEQVFQFEIVPPKNESQGFISPIVSIDNHLYSIKWIEIDYEHIPFQTVVMQSEAQVLRLNLEKKGNLIGYIHGAGDEVPASLRQMGYTVVELKDEDVSPDKLQNFDAVVLGIRAYNTNEKAKFYQKYLHSYVENGGTLIVQYNTNNGLKVDQVGIYPMKISRDRVTEENAKVRILNPSHEILNYPNKITDEDFENWTQERGLYFPNEWDAKFETILSINDTNEKPNDGSILTAKYGKGNFIYTGLSFFRQLPAGNKGALKLFTNMLSIGKSNVKNPMQK